MTSEDADFVFSLKMSPVVGCAEEEVYASVRSGNVAKLSRHLGAGLDVNHVFTSTRDMKAHGMSLIHIAVSENNLALIRFLLKKGCDIDQASRCQSFDGFRSRVHMVQHRDRLHLTCLFHAICSQNVEVIRELVGGGADVNLYDRSGSSALWHGIDTNNPRITEAILQAPGCDVNLPDSFQMTPLHVASVHKNPVIVGQLLERGALVDPRQLQGATPLYIASRSASTSSIKLLLQHGADPNITDLDGITPLNIALERSTSPQLVCMLIHAGAFVFSRSIFFLQRDFDLLKNNPDLDEYMRLFLDAPRCLKTLSMLRIKELLKTAASGRSIYKHIQQLPLPKVLLNFLLLQHF